MAEYRPNPAIVNVAELTDVPSTTSRAKTGIAGVGAPAAGTMFQALLVIQPALDGGAEGAAIVPIACSDVAAEGAS